MEQARRNRVAAASPQAGRAQPAAPGGFWNAVRLLGDNPLAYREWRGLCAQMRDWRLWVGLRVPRDGRGWGLPAVALFILAPYILWLLLLPMSRFDSHSARQAGYYLNVLGLIAVASGLYLVLICVHLCAAGFQRERERETWPLLALTTLTNDELLLGFAVGRMGPVVLGGALAGGTLALLRPNYAALLADLAPVTLGSGEILLATAWCLLLGMVGGVWALSVATLAPSVFLASVVDAVGFAGVGVALGLSAASGGLPSAGLTTFALVALTPGFYLAARRGLRRRRVEP